MLVKANVKRDLGSFTLLYPEASYHSKIRFMLSSGERFIVKAI
jgi:hypothetical protein